MAITPANDAMLSQYRSHPRQWRRNDYVYPVLSRRAGGLSIGVNLNPDTACNFDCIYCQVDRTGTPRVRHVEPARLRDELSYVIQQIQSGALFDEPAFADVPTELRAIQDIAFSGDGEPTTCKQFAECVEITADVKRAMGLKEVKIVLITDACYLTRPEVVKGLAVMDQNQGEIWAKLDAGTEEYYRRINRPNVPLQHVIDNIIATARVRSVVIQSLFMRIQGQPPAEGELLAFVNRLLEITRAGGCIKQVQVYTIARRPAESYVTPLSSAEVDHITALVRTRADLRAEPYYGQE